MDILEAALALIGLLALILIIIGLCVEHSLAPSPDEDIAAPYREGLHAAIRLHVAAQNLEQRLHAVAAWHAEDHPNGER